MLFVTIADSKIRVVSRVPASVCVEFLFLQFVTIISMVISIFLIFLASTSIMFVVGYLISKNTKQHLIHWREYSFHHSILGILLILLSFFFKTYKEIVFPIGLGIYISHGFEEIYFNHISIKKAFFVFVTKSKKQN